MTADAQPPPASPTAQEVLDRLHEEWEVLGLMSYSGTNWGGMVADLNEEDIAKIRALLRDAGAVIEAYG